jgi:hypothetical protein
MSYQDLTGGTGTSFTLDNAAGSAQDIEVFVNNVRQEPGVAYTVSGTALTMTGSIASTDDFYVVFQGKAQQTVTPANNSITATMLQSGAVTDAKIDTMAASKLTGALPAIDGSALTGISSGGVSQVVSHVIDATTYFERNTTANTHQLLNTTNANDGTSHMSVTITPSSASSKIMITMNLNWTLNGADVFNTLFALDRSGTLLLPAAAGNRRLAIAVATPMSGTSSAANYMHTQYMLYVDEPNTTSAITYTVTYASTAADASARLWFNRTQTDSDTAGFERGVSTLVAQEI